MNAALNEPLMTEMASEGTMKATRNASMASAVPNDAATTSSFAVETTLAPKVNEAMMSVALKILRFVETFDQSVHFFNCLLELNVGKMLQNFGHVDGREET